MASLNRVLIMGNLGIDPELRHTASGHAVTTLRIATSHTSKDEEGQPKEVTEWHSVVVWDRQAEACATYLRKGRSVFVEGRLQTRVWEGPDGAKHYATEIIAYQVSFLGGRQPDAPQGKPQEAAPAEEKAADLEEPSADKAHHEHAARKSLRPNKRRHSNAVSAAEVPF